MTVSGKAQSTPRAKIGRIIGQLEALYGIPTQPRRRTPPLDMLIATILSQNTNDINSHRAYSSLRKKFPTWPDVLAARRSAVAGAIRTGGMADQKSASIKGVLAGIQKRFGVLDLSVLSG